MTWQQRRELDKMLHDLLAISQHRLPGQVTHKLEDIKEYVHSITADVPHGDEPPAPVEPVQQQMDWAALSKPVEPTKKREVDSEMSSETVDDITPDRAKLIRENIRKLV